MTGLPPLQPFGLILHHDASWTHEGVPILNRKLREKFDRSVRYLPEADAFVVQVGHFRGQIEVEEAAFFVRSVDPLRGTLRLSDGEDEALDVDSLHASPRDGAWLCRVKRALQRDGLLARFSHAAQAEILAEVEESAQGLRLRWAGESLVLPPL